MGAVGVRGIPRHGRRHRHRPAKSEPKSPFRFRSRAPLVAAQPHCVLGATVTSLPRCCARPLPRPPPARRPTARQGCATPQPEGQGTSPRRSAASRALARPQAPACAGLEGGVGTPGSRGSRNRERTANLAVFGPPWAGGGPAYPLPPPVRSPPLNPVSPVFARVYRLATGAGKRTATRARGGFLTACDYVLSVLLPPTMVLALRLGFASGVVLSSLRTYQQTNPLPSY